MPDAVSYFHMPIEINKPEARRGFEPFYFYFYFLKAWFPISAAFLDVSKSDIASPLSFWLL